MNPAGSPHLEMRHIVEPLRGIPDPARYPAISPDGKRLAFSCRNGGSWRLVLRELATGFDRGLTMPLVMRRCRHGKTPIPLSAVVLMLASVSSACVRPQPKLSLSPRPTCKLYAVTGTLARPRWVGCSRLQRWQWFSFSVTIPEPDDRR